MQSRAVLSFNGVVGLAAWIAVGVLVGATISSASRSWSYGPFQRTSLLPTNSVPMRDILASMNVAKLQVVATVRASPASRGAPLNFQRWDAHAVLRASRNYPVASAGTLPDATIEHSQAHSNQWAARLYTLAGHNRATAYDALPAAGLAPATKETQAEIYRRQFPASCSGPGASFLLSHSYCNNGIGSMIHVVGTQLAIAVAANRTLVMAPGACPAWGDNETCPDGASGFFECFLAPISSCTAADAAQAGADVVAVTGTSDDYMSTLPPGVLLPQRVPAVLADRVHHLGMTEHELKYWWRGQSAAYLLRFNERTIAAVREMRLKPGMLVAHSGARGNATGGPRVLSFPLPPGVVSAHMRSGYDKGAEMSRVLPSAFFRAVEGLVKNAPISARRVIFLSTEGADTIESMRRIVTRHANAWTLLYTATPRGVGGSGAASREAAVHLPSAAVQRLGVSTQQHLLNLLIALECSAFVGTRGSNWNRLIDELRCIWVPNCNGIYVEAGDNAAEYGWRR